MTVRKELYCTSLRIKDQACHLGGRVTQFPEHDLPAMVAQLSVSVLNPVSVNVCRPIGRIHHSTTAAVSLTDAHLP